MDGGMFRHLGRDLAIMALVILLVGIGLGSCLQKCPYRLSVDVEKVEE